MIGQIFKSAKHVTTKHFFYIIGLELLKAFMVLLTIFGFGFLPGVVVAVAWLFEAGLNNIYLNAYSGEYLETPQLFFAFRNWKTAKHLLCGLGWMTLKIFLWSLIPIVGWVFAIIKLYSWRLTPYILIKEPEIEAKRAIYISESRTLGYRGSMFGIDILIFVCPMIVIALFAAFSLIEQIRIFFLAFTLLLTVIVFLVLPILYNLVHVGFYKALSNTSSREESEQIPSDF